jgi:DNA-binding cell septation regulator SpoVG
MKFNSIKIYPLKDQTSMKAKADVSLETEHGEFSIKGFRIVQIGSKEPFVGSPQEKYMAKGVMQYKDILYLDRKFQAFICTEIIKEYKKQVAGLRVA